MLTAPRRTEIVRAPRPEPAAGEVRVVLAGSGVCGSNVPVWEGRPWFSYPLPPGAPGHEGWGHVDALGDDVGSVASGDRVALLCESAFAEQTVVPAEMVVPLPDDPRLDPFPGEALGCAVNVVRRAGVAAGDTVAVVGIGFLGAAVTALAAAAGARVIAISRRAYSLDVARAMGAAETVVMDDHQRVMSAVRDRTGGELCSHVVEAVGAQWPLDLATELTRVHGRLVIAGYHQDGPRSVNLQLWNWRGIDVVNAHERDPRVQLDGIRLAAAAVLERRIDPSPLYTHTFPIDRVGDGLDAAVERPDGFMKALVSL